MDAQVISTIISGVFSIVSAFGAIILKDFLDRREAQDSPAVAPAENPYKSPTEIPATPGKPLRSESRPKPSYRSPWVVVIPVVTVVVGATVGVVSRLLRPYAHVRGAHYETLGALAVLTVSCLVLVVCNRKGQGLLGHVLYQLENFALWTGFACGWSLVHGYFWGDLIGVSIAWWFCCSVFGSVVLALVQWRRRSIVAI
jgi:hypothetical protein